MSFSEDDCNENLIKQALKIKSGSSTPNTVKVGKLTRQQLEEIAKVKEPDITAASLPAAVRTIAGDKDVQVSFGPGKPELDGKQVSLPEPAPMMM